MLKIVFASTNAGATGFAGVFPHHKNPIIEPPNQNCFLINYIRNLTTCQALYLEKLFFNIACFTLVVLTRNFFTVLCVLAVSAHLCFNSLATSLSVIKFLLFEK